MKPFPQNLRIRCLTTLLALLTSFTAGCATTTQQSPTTTPETLAENDTSPAFHKALQAADEAWQQRLDRTQLEAAITHWQDALTHATPGITLADQAAARAEIYEKIARAFYFLADSHIRLSGTDEEANHPDMKAAYENGIAAAETALTLRDPAFVEKITAGQPWQEAVSTANRAAIPALYWYSANLGNWALIEGIATRLARKDDVKATMDFIIATQPDYFYGAAYRYLGVYWVTLPFGNDPEQSQAAFAQSLRIAPNYFATHVLTAQYLAKFTNNSTLFNEQIDFVLNTPADILPELEPENTLEQEKARRLRNTATPAP